MLILIVLVFAIGGFLFYLEHKSLSDLKQIIKQLVRDFESLSKSRHSVIPLLINEAQPLMHKDELIAQILNYSRLTFKAVSPEEKMKAEAILLKKIQFFKIQVQNFPVLMKNPRFLQFFKDYLKIDAEIDRIRRRYNQTVSEYNQKLLLFPTNLISQLLGFKKCQLIYQTQRS